MFIATADLNDPSSVGAKCGSTGIIFRSYGACLIYLGLIVYRHFVPTGLRPFSRKLFCHLEESNTLNGTLPSLPSSPKLSSRLYSETTQVAPPGKMSVSTHV